MSETLINKQTFHFPRASERAAPLAGGNSSIFARARAGAYDQGQRETGVPVYSIVSSVRPKASFAAQ
jgi:hypothetical protein